LSSVTIFNNNKSWSTVNLKLLLISLNDNLTVQEVATTE